MADFTPTDSQDPAESLSTMVKKARAATPNPSPGIDVNPGTTGNPPPKGNPSPTSPPSTTPSTTPSTSSSSSTPAAPPVDPIVAAKESQFQSIYTSLWGEPATKGYITAAAKSGMNIWEFAMRERHKPAFVLTNTYKTSNDKWAQLIHDMGAA